MDPYGTPKETECLSEGGCFDSFQTDFDLISLVVLLHEIHRKYRDSVEQILKKM